MTKEIDGFAICDIFDDGNYCEIVNYNDNNGDAINVVFNLNNKFLKFSDRISNIDNLEFVLNKMSHKLEKMDYEFAIYVNDFDNYYRNDHGNEKYKRNDIKCSSFIASLGNVVGLNIKSRKFNGYILFLPNNYDQLDEKSFNNLKEISSKLNHFENLTVMVCSSSYENNDIYENELAQNFLDRLDQTKKVVLSK